MFNSSSLQVTVHRNLPVMRTVYAAVFVAMHACTISFAISTAGQPYQDALVERAKLEAKLANGTNETNETGAMLTPSLEEESVPAVNEAVATDKKKVAADKKKAAAKSGGGGGGGGGFGDEEWPVEEEEEDVAAAAAAQGSTGTTANATLRFNATKAAEERPLPHEWLPSALACALLFAGATLNCLFYLLCHWLISFKARWLFGPERAPAAGRYLYFVPLDHKGRPALVKLSVANDEQGLLCCEYQRQRYEVLPAAEAKELTDGDELVGADECAYAVRLISCPVDKPFTHYARSKGIEDAVQERQHQERYGTNILSVATPRFVDLYVEQLLSPLVIFQLFTSALWLLDAVSYGFLIFNIFTILALESTSVFQRQRTLKTLNQMSAKPYNLFVFRHGQWTERSTTDLLPGDLISLANKAAATPAIATPVDPKPTADGSPTDAASSTAVATPAATPPPGRKRVPPPELVVPCDCLLLRGSAVVNEASLTGESVPQMKDRLSTSGGGAASDAVTADETKQLELMGRDRVHVMFAGTILVTSKPGEVGQSNPGVPAPPDGGCLCYVLRSGFLSAQGELMMMIEFSQQKVGDDSKDTLLALFILLIFALMASGFVFKKGLEKGDRTTHELLLKCVIIVTSVVPRHLPMQTALAVNTALMALMKAGVMCTEPYRVPTAGKIDAVLFDKTGTLTTDKLVPVGIVNGNSEGTRGTADDGKAGKAGEAADASSVGVIKEVEVSAASSEAAVVIAGCHSLIAIDDQSADLLGDPIETAALAGVRWSYDHKSQTATPGALAACEAKIADLTHQLAPPVADPDATMLNGQPAPPPPPLPEGTAAKLREELEAAKQALEAAKELASRSEVRTVQILQRHHFSSALQRMSTVARVALKDGTIETRCLVKGSPEAIKLLLRRGAAPSWYDTTYRSLAERGMRVLALAHKVSTEHDRAAAAKPREWVEDGLLFAGFIAFACKTRADSPTVVRALLDSAHKVMMLTGDAPLTALHVAKEVHICSPERTALLLTDVPEGGGGGGGAAALRWVKAVGGSDVTVAPFAVETLRTMSETYDLMVEGKTLDLAAEASGGGVWGHVDVFGVFARMSPPGKAHVIRMLQELQHLKVLMCGDGGNDVGALKQSDVGLALLSGYGNTNTTDEADLHEAEKAPEREAGMSSAEVALNKKSVELAEKAKKAMALQQAAFKAKQKELQAMQQVWMQEELKKLQEQGIEPGAMDTFRIMKATLGRMQRELVAERERLASIHGNIYDNAKAAAGGMAGGGADLEPETGMPMVRPGDASVAAPFTSRQPSVRHIVDLIRQGRCTLLSALQQQQIMMLESTISAFVYSALSLEGARSSERQMMASSWLLMIANLAFSYATPLQKMHPQRPLKSLFHPAVAVSMAGQAAIHLFAMYTAVHMSREVMGPEKLKEVVEFHRRERLREQQQLDSEKAMEDGDYMASMMALWTTPFMPNLLNTSVFLVETSQCIAILLVNYKGRPFMKGISENHPLFLSVFACVAGCVCCAWGVFPELNTLIHLEAFPDDDFRFKVIGLVIASLFGTFLWDRLCTAIFAPKIFDAMMDEAMQTTPADMLPALYSLGKVVAVLLVLGSGNLLVAGLMYWTYRKYLAGREQAQQAAAERRANQS